MTVKIPRKKTYQIIISSPEDETKFNMLLNDEQHRILTRVTELSSLHFPKFGHTFHKVSDSKHSRLALSIGNSKEEYDEVK